MVHSASFLAWPRDCYITLTRVAAANALVLLRVSWLPWTMVSLCSPRSICLGTCPRFSTPSKTWLRLTVLSTSTVMSTSFSPSWPPLSLTRVFPRWDQEGLDLTSSNSKRSRKLTLIHKPQASLSVPHSGPSSASSQTTIFERLRLFTCFAAFERIPGTYSPLMGYLILADGWPIQLKWVLANASKWSVVVEARLNLLTPTRNKPFLKITWNSRQHANFKSLLSILPHCHLRATQAHKSGSKYNYISILFQFYYLQFMRIN